MTPLLVLFVNSNNISLEIYVIMCCMFGLGDHRGRLGGLFYFLISFSRFLYHKLSSIVGTCNVVHYFDYTS